MLILRNERTNGAQRVDNCHSGSYISLRLSRVNFELMLIFNDLYTTPGSNAFISIVTLLNNYLNTAKTLNKYKHFLYIQIIHRTFYLIKSSRGDMCIYFSGFTARMAHHTLYIPKVNTIFKAMRGKRMPQRFN